MLSYRRKDKHGQKLRQRNFGKADGEASVLNNPYKNSSASRG
jgi:hypothetical protein